MFANRISEQKVRRPAGLPWSARAATDPRTIAAVLRATSLPSLGFLVAREVDCRAALHRVHAVKQSECGLEPLRVGVLGDLALGPIVAGFGLLSLGQRKLSDRHRLRLSVKRLRRRLPSVGLGELHLPFKVTEERIAAPRHQPPRHVSKRVHHHRLNATVLTQRRIETDGSGEDVIVLIRFRQVRNERLHRLTANAILGDLGRRRLSHRRLTVKASQFRRHERHLGLREIAELGRASDVRPLRLFPHRAGKTHLDSLGLFADLDAVAVDRIGEQPRLSLLDEEPDEAAPRLTIAKRVP
jgi:hypothetical protein